MSTGNPIGVLVTGATVVTLDDALGTLEDGAVAVRGGRIAAVGPSADLARDHPDLEVLDARGKAVLPGFINSHTHTVLLVLRGTVEDMAGDAIFGYMTPISFAMTPEERAAIARLGCLEGILCGTTTMVEPFRHVAGYARGMVDTGLRLYLSENAADALTLKIRHGVYEHDRAFGQEFLDRTVALIERFHGAEDGRVHCQISARAPDVCSPCMPCRSEAQPRQEMNRIPSGVRRVTRPASTSSDRERTRRRAARVPGAPPPPHAASRTGPGRGRRRA